MLDFPKYPFVVLTTSVILGILLYIYTQLQIDLCVTIMVALVLIIFKLPKSIKEVLIIIFFLLYGCSMSYYRLKSKEFLEPISIKGVCKSKIGENGYLIKSKIGLIYLSKYHIYSYTNKKHDYKIENSILTFPTVGDSIRLECKLLRTNSSSKQFDRFLLFSDIKYKTKYITYFDILSHNNIPLFKRIQRHFISKIDSLYHDKTVSSIIKAICIGYRETISTKTKDLFTTTGCVHLLAVSGLHVGAIFILISNLLKLIPIEKKYVELMCIPFLWIYTLITGYSPSAIRASIILTFIILGNSYNKDDNKLNILFASAFLTLIVNPLMLCNISFQLSYCAYAGIILFYKPLSNYLEQKIKLNRLIANAISISIAAQILITPLSFYYFKAINISNFIINTLILPLTAPLLYSSVITIVLPIKISFYLSIIPNFLTKLLLYILNLLSNLVYIINIENISILHILFTYASILSIFSWFINPNRTSFKLSCIALITQIIYCCIYNLI